MTDIVEQAARVLFIEISPISTHDAEDAAQALADAGLLAEPATPREQIKGVMRPSRTTDMPPKPPSGRAGNSGAHDQPCPQPALTVPTREEIAEALCQWNTLDDPHFVIYGRSGDDSEGNAYYPIADAILALLAGQPTVNEAKARALEEAAAEIKAQTLEEVAHVLAEQEHFTKKTQGAKELKDRAQQIRGGK